MRRQRISLFTYDVLRELCDRCREERFHFVPSGAMPVTGRCPNCGQEREVADFSDSAVFRLVTQPNGDVVVVPVIAAAAR
jgi:uncharacterized protein (DUF983 family)